ncbi:hypothetical protein JI739_06410 [Ramlibacter sp. AW1]|uniref:Uncharacterized protein n=1 Tax=Ramlibacter aurantiacus TaxID=2801330 RepID=A0A937D2Q9_9BURK|nr:hypothetical protein [Ramlibacter aurantiacus]MBL0419975.1 hypothetical protein [Ramlibacter aurantiacus]
MRLDFLEFDYSEDAEGNGSFDAMASAMPAQWPALQAEVASVLAWAEREFAHARGSLDEGGQWDVELQGVSEVATPLELQWESSGLRVEPGQPAAPRVTLSLTVSGTPAFCAALRAAFELG